MRKIYTAIYSRNSVLEFREGVKVKQSGDWKEIEGRLIARAATLESGEGHKEIVMSLTPTECYKLGLVAKQVAKSTSPTKKRAIVHNPTDNRWSEILVEYWRNNDRSGYAIILQVKEKEGDNERIVNKINVPTTNKVELLALADFLLNLNTLLRWREVIKVEQQESSQEPAPAEEELDDLIDDDIDEIEL